MTRFRRIVVLGVVGAAVTSPALAHDGGPRVPEWKPAAVAAQQRAEPPIVATPRADCLPGGIPEGAMQGRVPAGADKGYRYVVRFTMAGDRRALVLARGADGRMRVRPPHVRRASCDLVRSFRLRRPVFGGGTPLAGSYHLATRARATVTVARGRKVVKRFTTAERRTFRFVLTAHGLPRGNYTVRLVARSGDDQASAVVGARRL